MVCPLLKTAADGVSANLKEVHDIGERKIVIGEVIKQKSRKKATDKKKALLL